MLTSQMIGVVSRKDVSRWNERGLRHSAVSSVDPALRDGIGIAALFATPSLAHARGNELARPSANESLWKGYSNETDPNRLSVDLCRDATHLRRSLVCQP